MLAKNVIFSSLSFMACVFMLSTNANQWNESAHYSQEPQQQVGWQSEEDLQRIREYRLQQWQEQQQYAAPQEVIYNEPRQNAPQQAQIPDTGLFLEAAQNGNVAQMRQMLSQGLDINVSNSERETALHMAAARGHYQAVIFLINQGAYVNAPTVKRWIPLHHAVRFRHHNIANFLIHRGAPSYARTSDGLTAVDIARNVNDARMLGLLGAR